MWGQEWGAEGVGMSCSAHARRKVKVSGKEGALPWIYMFPGKRSQPIVTADLQCSQGWGGQPGTRTLGGKAQTRKWFLRRLGSGLRFVFALSFHPKRAYW